MIGYVLALAAVVVSGADAACSGCNFLPPRSRAITGIMIDTDADFDDLIAIMVLSSPYSPLDILHISATGVGAASLDKGVDLVLRTMNVYPNRKVTHGVSRGYSMPLSYSNSFPRYLRVCADNNFNMSLPEPRKDIPVQRDAVASWCATLTSQKDGSVAVLALGGGTTLASVQAKCPDEYARAVGVVYAMGGTLPGERGNVDYTFLNMPDGSSACPYMNEAAEWNVFLDPVGFQTGIIDTNVVTTPNKTTALITTTASHYLPITRKLVETLRDLSPSGKLAYESITAQCICPDLDDIPPGMALWDVVAALVVISPDIFCARKEPVAVQLVLNMGNDTSGAIVTHGSSVAGWRPAVPRPISLGVCLDHDTAEAMLLKALSYV